MKLLFFIELIKRTFFRRLYFSLVIGAFLCSCVSYKQNIMFKDAGSLQKEIRNAGTNYIIQKNDHLKLEVFTSRGERLIDPDLKLVEGASQNQMFRTETEYFVDHTGTVKFPMLGEIKLEGLTIRQAEEILQKEYARFYLEPYVILDFLNKRVIVLGAPGGQVIPLTNENTRLTEVLALAKGIDNNAKAHNIRIIRGDEVFVADLTTIEGYNKGNIIIESGDIVYVEPVRKPLIEGIRDYGPIFSLITSVATLIVVITNTR